MTVRQTQYGIAAVFFVLGGWCLLAPQHVMDTVMLPRYKSDDRIMRLFVACFGAQACISGLFAAFSRFTRLTFLAYGVVLLPFFVFNYWYTAVEPVFNNAGYLDLAGNAIMLVLCFHGWRQASAEALLNK